MSFNRILLIVFIAWFVTQTIKLIVYWIINRKFVCKNAPGKGAWRIDAGGNVEGVCRSYRSSGPCRYAVRDSDCCNYEPAPAVSSGNINNTCQTDQIKKAAENE